MNTQHQEAQRTEFDYLLNRFERASQADKPAEHGYKGHRDALYAYVRGLERRASSPPAPTGWQPLTRKQINEASREAQIAFCLDKQPTYEVAFAREIERALGILPPPPAEVSNG